MARWTDRVHPSRVAHERASGRPSTREHPAEFSVESQQDLCTRFGAQYGDAQLYQDPAVLAIGCRLERAYRAEGALSMRAPEDVVGIQSVRAGDTHQWLRRALDGLPSPTTRSSHASQRLPQPPGRPCGAVSRGPEGFVQ